MQYSSSSWIIIWAKINCPSYILFETSGLLGMIQSSVFETQRQSTKQKSKKGQITGLDNYSKRNHLRTPRSGLDFSMINEFNLAM